MIWYNSFICIENKPFIWQKFYQAGITKIDDLFKSNGEPKPLENLEQEYNVKIPFTKYWGILKAIPKEWKEKMKLADSPDQYSNKNLFDTCCEPKALLSSIYKTLKKNDCLLDRVAQKWNKKVLLRERKRHTARHVASTSYVVLSWLTHPSPPAGPDPPLPPAGPDPPLPPGWT